MNYFSSMYQLWGLLFLCVMMGRLLLRFLPLQIRSSIGFYIAPLLGLASLILLVTLYGWLSPFNFILSITLVTMIIFITLFYEINKKALLYDWLQVSAFSSLCVLPIIAPIIMHGGYNPFTDIFTYLVQAQWLQIHPFSEKALSSGYYPALTQVINYQIAGSRMGGTFLLAFVQSLFSLKWSYYAYIPTVSLGFVAGCFGW